LKTLLKYFAVLQSLGLWGIFLIAALDGAGVPVPGAVDLIVATSVYQSPAKAWIYILLAAAGSTLGCLLLYVIGRLGGEVLVERRMSPEKFKKVQADFERHSFLTVAIPALLPPPFPFKIVVLSAGAFEMAWTHFLFAIFVGRLIRFGALSVLTIVFGAFGKMPDRGSPYPILVFCGMLPWQFFSTALSESGNSHVTNANLISKVYFPRLVVPASSVITSFVDFLISAAFLVVLMLWYRYLPSSHIGYLPIFVLLAFAASFGAGLWIAALMVDQRVGNDLGYILYRFHVIIPVDILNRI
jgi:membrane protein YqaA with SNARE-associated domain